jgi:hypothetical protein
MKGKFLKYKKVAENKGRELWCYTWGDVICDDNINHAYDIKNTSGDTIRSCNSFSAAMFWIGR